MECPGLVSPPRDGFAVVGRCVASIQLVREVSAVLARNAIGQKVLLCLVTLVALARATSSQVISML